MERRLFAQASPRTMGLGGLRAKQKIGLQEANIVKAICQDSFFEFVREFWSVFIPNKPVWNWHIAYFCYELQILAERVMTGQTKDYDLLVNVPPASTKSTIFSIMFPAWVWTKWPHAKFICGSFAEPLSLFLAQKARDVCQSEKYKACFPDVVIRDDQNTKSLYVTTKNGFRYSVGAGANITGWHADFIIIDDPLNPQATASDDIMRTINLWMTETLPSRMVDQNVGTMILVMQRLHQNDPSGCWLELSNKSVEYKIRHIQLPAEIIHTYKNPADDLAQVQPRHLRRKYTNDLFDPVRLSRKILTRFVDKSGEFAYACQMLQRPIPRGGGMFDVDKLDILTPPPESEFKTIVRYWDKAVTPRAGCFTVGLKMGITHAGKFWVLHVKRGQWGPDEREKIIVKFAEQDKKHVYVAQEVEPAGSGKESALATTRNLIGYQIYNDKPTGDKEVRADTFARQVGGGNVSLAGVGGPGDNWQAEYIKELQYFPYSTYKDQVDASSGAFAFLSTHRRRVGSLFNDTAA